MGEISGIRSIQNLGIFADTSEATNFGHLNLIFGLNGTGKSTLADTVRALSADSTSSLDLRRSFGKQGPQLVEIEFSDGSRSLISDGITDKRRDNIFVYDDAFVDRNIFSRHEIGADHRRNLTRLIIGRNAVDAQQEKDRAEEHVKTARQARLEAERALLAHVPAEASLEAFMETKRFDGEETLEKTDQKIVRFRETQDLKSRAAPTLPPLPRIEPLEFGKAAPDLTTTHEAAMNVIQLHANRHQVTPKWLSGGMKTVETDEACPFCGQFIADSSLIDAYKVAFDAEYDRRLSELETEFASRLEQVAAGTFSSLVSSSQRFAAEASAWAQCIDLEIPAPLSASALTDLSSSLSEIFATAWNASNLTASEQETLKRSWQTHLAELNSATAQFSDAAKEILNSIEIFQQKPLTQSDLDGLVKIKAQISLSNARYSPHAIPLVKKYKKSIEQEASAKQTQTETRKTFTKALEASSSTFHAHLNKRLEQLKVQFQITGLAADYLGGKSRSTFGLSINSIPITSSDLPSTFSTALSDGDKRALGFSFFLATIDARAEHNANPLTVHIDDPLSSLDSDRTNATINAILGLVGNHQVTVTSHDPWFLRQIEIEEKKAQGRQPHTATCLQILRTGQPSASRVSQVNLHDLCATQYFKRYRTVRDVVSGTSHEYDAAYAALRPLLEEYLRLKFPGDFAESNWMLDKMIATLKSANHDSKFDAMASRVKVLDDLRKFTNPPHHAGQGSIAVRPPSSQEVVSNCIVVLDLIHST